MEKPTVTVRMDLPQDIADPLIRRADREERSLTAQCRYILAKMAKQYEKEEQET